MASTDSSSDDDSSSTHNRRKRKHRKHSKEKESKKKKNKKRKSKKSHSSSKPKKSKHHDRDTASPSSSRDPRAASYALADALCRLLDDHPAMAEDFPAILVQLASGTALNLSQSLVRSRLTIVLRQLQPYGVYQENETYADIWKFRALSTKKDELVLIRVVRSLLDQIGVTMDAIRLVEGETSSSLNKHERNRDVRNKEAEAEFSSEAAPDPVQEAKNVENGTLQLIRSFGTSSDTTALAKELVSLCKTILDGEVISLDGLPDQRLKEALQHLFHEQCGMIPSEMEHDDDDDDDEDDTVGPPTTGLGLPDDASMAQRVAQRIQVVRQVCSEQAERVTKGPLPKLAMDDSDDDEDDGPLMPGQNRRTFGEASAPAAPVLGAEGGREEWMLVPGKFDLLTGLKSSQPIRNRQFSGKRGDDAGIADVVDPKIEAEIKALREEHEASRGLSLMEEHQLRKQQEEAMLQNKGKKADWKWDRSKDLDAGRRVDKNALNMMLGGANSNLQDKFHSSM